MAVVVPRAGFLKDAAEAFVRVFTPPPQQRDAVPRHGLGMGYSRTAPKKGAGARKPFADNYCAAATKVPEVQDEAAAAPAAAATTEASSYLGGAITHVIVVGDAETEPEWEGTCGGWTGEIHTRSRDGWVHACMARWVQSLDPPGRRCNS
jgi:hypothetical protein